MERKNITIREDQAEWVEEHDINLSQKVQSILDEEMGPDEDALAAAYKQNAEHATEVTEQWSNTSTEANDSLGAWDAEE